MCGVGDLLFPRVAFLAALVLILLPLLCLAWHQSEYAIALPLPHTPSVIKNRLLFARDRFHLLCVCWSRALTFFDRKSRRGGSDTHTHMHTKQLNFYRPRHTFIPDGRLHLNKPTLLGCHKLHTIHPDCLCISIGVHPFNVFCSRSVACLLSCQDSL